MRNVLIKYLLFLWTLLIGVSGQANGFIFIPNISPTVSPTEGNVIIRHLSDVVAPYIHAPKPTLTLFTTELFFEDIEEEIEEVESNKKQNSLQNCINRPSFSHLGLSSDYSYFHLANQNLKECKKYILNCVYLL